MNDATSGMSQDAQQGESDKQDCRDNLGRSTTAEAIQVLLLTPDETPQLQTIENCPDAIQAVVGGAVVTFPTGIGGTIGVANAEGAGDSALTHHAIDETGAGISGTFVVAGDVGDSLTLQSLSPLQLEQALERFAPTLPLAQFAQIVRSHTLGPEWIANWEPPEV